MGPEVYACVYVCVYLFLCQCEAIRLKSICVHVKDGYAFGMSCIYVSL